MSQTSDASFPAAVDAERPTIARLYDYWLGGSHHFPADRELGDRVFEVMPHLRATVLANRAYMRRVVAHLAGECGISQFLDIGSGVPTGDNTHQIARRFDPDTRVVYVDLDPEVVAYTSEVLAGDPHAAVINANMRDHATVVADPALRAVLDPTRPVAVLLLASLHFLPDADDPASVLRGYATAFKAGGYVAISHGIIDDSDKPQVQTAAMDDYREALAMPVVMRSPAELARWIEGYELCPPGLVPINRWHPEGEPGDDVLNYGALLRIPPAGS